MNQTQAREREGAQYPALSALLPELMLDRMAAALGVDKCSDDVKGCCEYCERPRGREWTSIGVDGEACYYVCDACLPIRYLEELRQRSLWNGSLPCFVCLDASGVFKKSPQILRTGSNALLISNCAACGDTLTLFPTLRPYGQFIRAVGKYQGAQSNAHKTGRRKKWTRVAVKWFLIAEREARTVTARKLPRRLGFTF